MTDENQTLSISVDQLLLSGMTIGGKSVVKLVIHLEDGHMLRLYLPVGKQGVTDDKVDADDDCAAAYLTPMQSAVVQALNEAKVGETLPYDVIAKRSGYSNTDSLRTFVRQLVVTRSDLVRTPRGIQRRG
jgi:hypothetical protein